MNIALFTCGDSSLLSTWSNVPYLFAKTLEEKGHVVQRVNIYPNKVLMRIFNSVSFYIFRKLLRKRSCPIYSRTALHRFIINRRIKKATKDNPSIDINLFLSYGFINKYSEKPSVLWCDWSDAIVIQRQHRVPEWYEKKSLNEEARAMKNAYAVFSMFPVCAKQMTKMYEREVLYLKRNVVNTVYNKPWNIDEIIEKRMESSIILFIGNYLYKSGALLLLDSFMNIRKRLPKIQLHIIGIPQSQMPIFDGLTCHGYLHKDNEQEKELYYKLIFSCKCLVNPTPQWAGYSSSIEAMFYGCPIIVSPYDEFVEEFGTEIKFGYYCHRNNLTACIESVLGSDQYQGMCREAHNTVEHYTWSEYVDDFLDSIKTTNTIV